MGDAERSLTFSTSVMLASPSVTSFFVNLFDGIFLN